MYKQTYQTFLSLRGNLREGYDDKERSIYALCLHEIGDEGNGLNGLSQTHLISQDAIKVVVIQGNKPLQTRQLQKKGKKHEF